MHNEFIEHLEELLASDIPLKKCLKLLQKNNSNNTLLHRLLLHLNNGLPFSKAIEKEKQHFDPLLPFFVGKGEAQGDLSQALKDFNDYQREKSSFSAKIKKITCKVSGSHTFVLHKEGPLYLSLQGLLVNSSQPFP